MAALRMGSACERVGQAVRAASTPAAAHGHAIRSIAATLIGASVYMLCTTLPNQEQIINYKVAHFPKALISR